MPQDLPPVGGYEQVQYKRNLPARGFRPVVYLLGMHVIMAYGYYKLFHSVREQHELAREKTWGRLHILPLLQAEEDRDQARRFFADKARERELFGHETKVYNTDRCRVFYEIGQGRTRVLDLTQKECAVVDAVRQEGTKVSEGKIAV